MYYTTFLKTKEKASKIEYLDLIINTNNEFDYQSRIEDITQSITIATPNIPNFIKQHYDHYGDYYLRSILPQMKNFIERYEFVEKKSDFYRKFSIPKRKGGWRHLIEPKPELKYIQQMILFTLSNVLKIRPYSAAHAFEPKKDAYTNAQIHKDSNYIIKYDFEDFFPSITKELLIEKLSHISQFAMLGEEFINLLAEIATFEGSLPQGSPLSPYLSNIIMTEFDYQIQQQMKDSKLPSYKYTRYADDLTFSAKTPGRFKELTNGIQKILEESYSNIIKLNKDKTKILKTTGRCYVTGVKINKDHQLTYGHEKKNELKHEICNMLIKFQNNQLTKEEAQSILGKWAYLKRIEPQYADYLEKKYLKMFNSQHKTFHKHLKAVL